MRLLKLRKIIFGLISCIVLIEIVMIKSYAVNSNAAICASELKKTYCINEKKIPFKVENTGNEDLWIGIFVEKRHCDGTWFEFCSDIHQKRANTQALAAKLLPQGVKMEFVWEPLKAGRLFALEPGEYRLIALINRKDEVPGRNVELGSFVLTPCPKTPKPVTKQNK